MSDELRERERERAYGLVAFFGDQLWPWSPSRFHTEFVSIASIFTIGIIIQIFWVDERTRGIDDITIRSDVITSSVPETFTTFSRIGSGVMRVGGGRGREDWSNETTWGIGRVTAKRLCCCGGWGDGKDERGKSI